MFNFGPLEVPKVKISIVNYTNTMPFKWALRNSELLQQIDLQEDIPSICAQKLKFDQVDLALVPVALLADLQQFFIETDYCIGADGKVDSVKLYSEVPLNDITEVLLDYQSRSSITLTRVLFKFFWKKEPKFLDAGPGFESQISGKTAATVIGDRTFSLNGKFAYEFDLAEEWKKFTGLPFVFAAWVSTKKLDPGFIGAFNAVLKNGVTHVAEAVSSLYENKTLSAEQTLEYLTERIDYRLDEEKRKALGLFLSYIRQL
jgi:chorismate dehydratase